MKNATRSVVISAFVGGTVSGDSPFIPEAMRLDARRAHLEREVAALTPEQRASLAVALHDPALGLSRAQVADGVRKLT